MGGENVNVLENAMRATANRFNMTWSITYSQQCAPRARERVVGWKRGAARCARARRAVRRSRGFGVCALYAAGVPRAARRGANTACTGRQPRRAAALRAAAVASGRAPLLLAAARNRLYPARSRRRRAAAG
jgi:hypothetical protein